MGPPSQYWFVVLIGSLGICCLCWRTSITLSNPSVVAKASIEVDLSLPSSSLITQRLFNNTAKRQSTIRGGHYSKRRNHSPVSRFMIQLYNRRPNADIVRALKPLKVSSSTRNFRDAGGRVLEFKIPPITSWEDLESAELFGSLGTIVRVRTMDQRVLSDVRRSRKDENWRAFDVTSVVNERIGDVVRLLVNGRVVDNTWNRDEGPILVLSYAKPKIRKNRAVNDDDHEDGTAALPWIEEGGRRLRRRNLCRRRPLYVDFASIAYDEWVVAPPGYEAYQCVGKCFYPFGDHLSPTKHAIVQTLVHGVLQGADGVNGKPVGRACCVPTRLAPTSLLYIDAGGTLTYQYGYEDMVVAECGCR